MISRFAFRNSHFLLGLGVASVLGVVRPPALSAAAEAPTRVVIGHFMASTNATPVWVAEDRGFFTKHGLEAEVLFVEGGTRGGQAMMGGSVAVASSSGATAISIAAGGGDVIIIAGVVNNLPHDVWAVPSITRVEDLKGKNIGISTFGSSSHVGVLLFLKHFNLDPTRDGISILQVGSARTRLAALQAGRIHATIAEPGVGAAARSAKLSHLANLEKLGIPYQHTAFITTRRFARESPQVVEKVLQAIAESYAFILNPSNKPEVLRILSRKLKLDPAQAEDAYPEVVKDIEVVKSMHPTVKGLQNMIDFLEEKDPRLKSLRAEDFVDMSFVDRLHATGFIKALYEK